MQNRLNTPTPPSEKNILCQKVAIMMYSANNVVISIYFYQVTRFYLIELDLGSR